MLTLIRKEADMPMKDGTGPCGQGRKRKFSSESGNCRRGSGLGRRNKMGNGSGFGFGRNRQIGEETAIKPE